MKQTDSILTEHFYLGRKNGKGNRSTRQVLRIDVPRDTVYYRYVGGSLHGREKTESIAGFRDWALCEVERPPEADLPPKPKSTFTPYTSEHFVTRDLPTPEALQRYKNEFRAILGRYVI